MSQRRSRKQRRAGSQHEAQVLGERPYRALLSLIDRMPDPSDRPTGNWTGSDQVGGHAPAVAWGWLMRLARTGEAAVELEKLGFGAETAPLTRSCLEHAIRLLWAADHGPEFVDVALLSQESGYQTMLNSQTPGWTFDPNLAHALEEHIEEANEIDRSLSTLSRLRHIVDLDVDRRGQLYMAWLFDTQESHPSLASARAYFSRSSEDEARYFLHRRSRFTSNAAALKACFALIAGVHGYAKIVSASDCVEPQLETIIRELYEIVGLDFDQQGQAE